MAQYIKLLEEVNLKDSWLTIGTFDGVHLGHQEIMRGLVAGAHAADSPAVVIDFHPHPAVVLGKRHGNIYLTTPVERAEIMWGLGVDTVITHQFDKKTAETSAYDFISMVKRYTGFRWLWIGPDFALGRDREGDANMLQHLGKSFGYQVQIVMPFHVGGKKVSSSQIRELLLTGEVENAWKLLGRPYQVCGEVVRGDGRGQTIGIPTANLATGDEKLIPGTGVYACQATIEDQKWPAATNIGVRPTFDNQSSIPHVEAHLLDFRRDLYGQVIQLEFIARLRGEQRFPDVHTLVEQIHKDIRQTRDVIASYM